MKCICRLFLLLQQRPAAVKTKIICHLYTAIKFVVRHRNIKLTKNKSRKKCLKPLHVLDIGIV